MIDSIASYIKFTGNVHLLLVLSTDPIVFYTTRSHAIQDPMVFIHVSILDPSWNIPRWLQETLPLEPPFRFTKIWAKEKKNTHLLIIWDPPRNLTYIVYRYQNWWALENVSPFKYDYTPWN